MRLSFKKTGKFRTLGLKRSEGQIRQQSRVAPQSYRLSHWFLTIAKANKKPNGIKCGA